MGSFILILKATAIGTLYLSLFLVLSIVTYTMPAILLYSGMSKILSIPIIINKENRLHYKISLAANFLFLFIGVIIILIGVYTGHYIMVVLGFIFTLLSYSNVKALDSCIKENESGI